MKPFVLILLALVLSATLVCSSSQSWGQRQLADQLLLNETIVLRSDSSSQGASSVILQYPEQGSKSAYIVSAIFASDLSDLPDSSAEVSLAAGGPGYNFVALRLRGGSGRGMAISMSIVLYGA